MFNMEKDKKMSTEAENINQPTHSRVVENRTLENVMEYSFLRYSMSVIVDRALPDVRDGLKPVHRRILYSMERNGWRFGTKYTKSARITGDVMGKYHPHGDSAIYDTVVRMAQDFSLRYTLVDGQGNFGSVDGDNPAAMRYTEARLAYAAETMLTDLDKKTVVFIPNFAVSNAQLIYAASDISEQISVAGAEASGTSNMKLMMNAALTLGTYDGSNIEISELAGPENIKIFGLRADEVQQVYASGTYFAQNLLNQNPTLARIVNMLTDGSLSRLSGNFESIHDYLLINNDPDLVLIDFDAYVKAWEELTQSYADRRSWNARALHNTANSGFFSADRTIREYMEDIWHV